MPKYQTPDLTTILRSRNFQNSMELRELAAEGLEAAADTIDKLCAALDRIVLIDQHERISPMDMAPGDNPVTTPTYAIGTIDGPCAEIARRALEGK